MLAEALGWLLTPAPWWARRRGLVGEQMALLARHRRCRAAWAPHLAACRAFLAEAASNGATDGGTGGSTVAVLGSGALLDVPLDPLAAAYGRVLLVDAVHPWRARWRAARHRGRVRLIHHDLASGLPEAAHGADLVLSVNLLSRLPDPGAHLAALADSRAAALVSDVELIESQGDVELARRDLLAGCDLALTAPRGWTWKLAPAPELYPDRDLSLRVVAGWVSRTSRRAAR
ncbi:hypothetical protein [Roseospirillum parvum]|uniref:Methyltransferase domain-containing protein n=1 Tax=Roseospirillum parvum TaxID=83401 RepID=A0A1G8EFU6_9PROT|nr:hypothetical protein [Roseospirillum parvum]SDH68559.1 hypothetical protein SAMN05421742_11021 [Roseospirillum parvum]